MFEKVLFPTDFSPDSQRILGYVKDIPGVKKVILLHVVDATHPSRRGWEYGPHIENAKILMEENRQTLSKNGIQADVIIETIVSTITQGDIPLTILEKADVEGVSLIVMGARGRNTIQSILLGSVSANVVRHAHTPVLLMRFPPASRMAGEQSSLFSRVIVPIDFSGPSLDALTFLKAIPAAGQVILLNVVDRGESEEEIRAAVSKAKERLFGIGRDLAASGIRTEPMVHVGYPPEEICATADRISTTLILMSPQGEGWTRELRALFIGSTTNTVMRNAHCPVLITAAQKTA